MTGLIDRIKAHYRALPARVIEVAEWGEDGSPLIIYGRAPTVNDGLAISQAGRNSNFDGLMEGIKRLASDADGKRLFSPENMIDLKQKASKEVVERVGYALLKDRDGVELMLAVEDALKN